jgi:DNA-damage-inducible protein D
MSEDNSNTAITPVERIRRTNPTGGEFWSSRDFAQVLGYTDYRNFEAVIEKARNRVFQQRPAG